MKTTLVIIVLYMLFIIGISIYASKKKVKSSEDYLLAGRSLGPIAMAASLSAAEIGGGSTVGVAAKAFGEWGLSAGWYVVTCGIGIFFVSFIAGYLRQSMASTVPEIIGRRYGNNSHAITTFLSIFALFFATAAQVVATSSIISVLTGIDLKLAIWMAGIVITFYTMLGGLASVAMADVVHIFFITIGMAVAVPFIIKNAGGWGHIKASLPPGQLSFTKIGWKTIFGLTLMYFMTFSTGQEAVQRYFAAKDMHTAKVGSFFSAIIMALYGFIPAIIGLVALAKFPQIDPNQAMAITASNLAPPVIGGLVLAAICAATMSSASGNMIAASTIFTQDVYKRYINPNAKDEKTIVISKLTALFIGVVSLFIALTNTDITLLLVFCFTIRSAGPFAAFVFGFIYKKATVNSGLYSILLGSIAALAWEYLGEPYGIMSVVFGSLVSTLVFFVVAKIESSMGVPSAPPAITQEHIDAYGSQ